VHRGQEVMLSVRSEAAFVAARHLSEQVMGCTGEAGLAQVEARDGSTRGYKG
jgi:hypothetical protein